MLSYFNTGLYEPISMLDPGSHDVTRGVPSDLT